MRRSHRWYDEHDLLVTAFWCFMLIGLPLGVIFTLAAILPGHHY